MTILTDHAINGVITQILELAEDERLPEREASLPPDLKQGLGRIFAFGRLVRDLLQRSAPEEVSLSGLNGVQSNLQQTYAELSAYVSNGNTAHLTNALTNLDNAANIYSWTFYYRPVRGAKPQFENVETVRRAAEKAISSISQQVEEFRTSMATTTASLQEQDARIAQLASTLDEVRGSSAAAVASIQQQFSENQSAFRSEIDALKSTFESQRESLVTEFSEKAERVITELNEQRDKAAKIVQVVGNIGVTGNYQTLADKENAAADRWRQITLGFFTAGVVLVSIVLLHHLFGNSPAGLDSLIVRFGLAAVVTLPALYAAGESSRHRRVAEQSRRTELQLASLNPFLATLPEEKRNEIIETLAPTYFVGSQETVESGQKEGEFDLVKVLGEVGNIVSRAKS